MSSAIGQWEYPMIACRIKLTCARKPNDGFIRSYSNLLCSCNSSLNNDDSWGNIVIFRVVCCCRELSQSRDRGDGSTVASSGSVVQKNQRLLKTVRWRFEIYPPFWVAYPVPATSVIVALFTMWARSTIFSSVGVGAAATNGARMAEPKKIFENFILSVLRYWYGRCLCNWSDQRLGLRHPF